MLVSDEAAERRALVMRYPVLCHACALTLLLAAGCSDDWEETSTLLDELRCGMTKTEIVSVLATRTTRTKHGIQWESTFDGRYYEVSLERGPNLSFYFSEKGLYAVRASETVAPMKLFLHP